MAHFLGERRLLITGLLFSIIEQAMLALVVNKWQALAAVSLGSLAGVSFPAISSIKSTHSRPDQQGLVQGALAGIRALATGLGPLAFAQLFSSCTKTTAGEGQAAWFVVTREAAAAF
jgi:DHA1 family tetracycline resistance protein-like MFS transporter